MWKMFCLYDYVQSIPQTISFEIEHSRNLDALIIEALT